MNQICTVIAYHYVRDLKKSEYPRIKGLHVDNFISQLDYLEKFYKFITIENLLDAIYHKKRIPLNSLLLTFDDGYIDHYEIVLPILLERGIQGSFFPPGKAVQESEVLDVNKIHFLLAKIQDVSKILRDIFSLLDKYREKYNLKSNDFYYGKLAKENRFDGKDIMFIKSLLQRGLKFEVRSKIIKNLFYKYVSKDEKKFAEGLYVNVKQLKEMSEKGMYIGCHSYNHFWLNSLNPSDQFAEIEESLDFLKKVGTSHEGWVMCYPYGGYNESLIKIIKEKGCALAFGTEMGIANLNHTNCFTLERLDTNDLPAIADSKPNEWTKKVI